MNTPNSEIARLQVEIELLKAQQGRPSVEIFWRPVGIAVAFIATVAGVTVALLRLSAG